MFVPPVFLLPSHGIAEYVRESSKALKDITEGQFDMTTVSEDGTMNLRFLVSGKDSALRMTVSVGDKTVNDVSVIGNEGVAVNHPARSFSDINVASFQRAAEKTKKKDGDSLVTVVPGTLSINLDPKEGLVIKATPELENVRLWASGNEELITGDIGKNKDRVGAFQWVRDAATKMPKSFSTTVKGHTTDIRFVVKERKVSLKELRIPVGTYRGYTRDVLPASGTL